MGMFVKGAPFLFVAPSGVGYADWQAVTLSKHLLLFCLQARRFLIFSLPFPDRFPIASKTK